MTTIVTTRVCSERDVSSDRFSRVYYVFSPRTNRVQFGNFTSNVFPNVGRTSVFVSRNFFLPTISYTTLRYRFAGANRSEYVARSGTTSWRRND